MLKYSAALFHCFVFSGKSSGTKIKDGNLVAPGSVYVDSEENILK